MYLPLDGLNNGFSAASNLTEFVISLNLQVDSKVFMLWKVMTFKVVSKKSKTNKAIETIKIHNRKC